MGKQSNHIGIYEESFRIFLRNILSAHDAVEAERMLDSVIREVSERERQSRDKSKRTPK